MASPALACTTGQARGPGPDFPLLDLEHATTIARSRANGSLYHGPRPTYIPSVGGRSGIRTLRWVLAGVEASGADRGTGGSGLTAALQAWRKLMGAVGTAWRPRPDRGSAPELFYLQALARVPADGLEASERRFAKFLEAHPTAVYAIEEHAAILDRLGRREQALANYQRARTSRERLKRGMPDRPFFMRHRTTSVAEINGYTNVLRAGPSKRGAFVYVARGHAFLATRRPRLALLDYDMALKLRPDRNAPARGKRRSYVGPGSSCRGLGCPRPGRCPTPAGRSTRSAAAPSCSWRSVAEANADWLRQLELLPRERPDARACVWLLLANYEGPWTNWRRRSRGARPIPTCSFII